MPETPKQNPRLLTNYQEVEEDVIMTIKELEKNYKAYNGGHSPFRSEQEVRQAPLGYQRAIAPCYLFSQARNTHKYENMKSTMGIELPTIDSRQMALNSNAVMLQIELVH